MITLVHTYINLEKNLCYTSIELPPPLLTIQTHEITTLRYQK